MTASRTASRWAAGLALGALVAVGCAYYNTLYNANEKYDEATKTQAAQRDMLRGETPPAGTRNPQTAAYEDVIAKCKKLVATYPKSRHVDDAMLLSAKALYQLGEYQQAVSAIDTLEERCPKSNLLDEARFLQGKSLVSAKEYDKAIPVLRDFIDHTGTTSPRRRISWHQPHASGASNDAMAALNGSRRTTSLRPRFMAQVEMAEIWRGRTL
jgi:tetratricopeptide (TPR) repeat protein